MRAFFCFLFVILACGGDAIAGAWLRETGTTFSSTGFTLNRHLESSNTTYLEHGLNDNMTIGVDFGQFRSRYGAPNGFTTFFMRRAIGSTEGKSRLAYELGAGTGWQGDLLSTHVKAGLSYGRGMMFMENDGWMALDGSVRWDIGTREVVSKLDATLGLNFNDRWAGMFQVYVAHIQGETFTTIAPSVILSPAKGKMRFQIGAESPLGRESDTAIKLGVWTEF